MPRRNNPSGKIVSVRIVIIASVLVAGHCKVFSVRTHQVALLSEDSINVSADAYAMNRPSGDHAGSLSLFGSSVNRF